LNFLEKCFRLSPQIGSHSRIQTNSECQPSRKIYLSVKVLGGTVSLDRTWTNGRWYFNPAWSNLKFKRNLEEEVQYVDRAGTVYERTGNQGDVYVFDDNQFIRRIVSSTGVVSWRWYNRSGASVNYDVDGLMQGYANRNGVKVIRSTIILAIWRLRLLTPAIKSPA
jgi:hypothetical protein